MKAAIIGGTGYGALELIRFIHGHPHVELEAIISRSQSGSDFSSVYPYVTSIIEQSLEDLDIDKLSDRVDLVFYATPPGVSMQSLPSFIANGVTCIDLSGDFRLKDPEAYETWYQSPSAPPQMLEQAIYGLSEINEQEIKTANLIANPGCFPTAALLALIPIIKEGLADSKSIIIDAKTGVSGAGRSLSLNTHYSETNENFKAYKLGAHKHIPEIEQALQKISGTADPVTFSTHLVPMTRGIMSTIYVDLASSQSTKEIIEFYQSFYKNDPFVRIRPEGILPSTKEVYGSNFCDLGFHADERTGKLTIVSVIDNLVKGASGQAIQNMNLINGWDVHTGLTSLPIYP